MAQIRSILYSNLHCLPDPLPPETGWRCNLGRQGDSCPSKPRGWGQEEYPFIPQNAAHGLGFSLFCWVLETPPGRMKNRMELVFAETGKIFLSLYCRSMLGCRRLECPVQARHWEQHRPDYPQRASPFAHPHQSRLCLYAQPGAV